MKPFFCTFLLLVFLSVFHGSQGEDLIHHVCSKITEDDKDLTYDFCKLTLHSIPAHQRPDMEHLGMASIDLVTMNIWETRQEITREFENKKNMNLQIENILGKCHEYYDEAISFLHDAMESFRHKKHAEANVKVTDALAKAHACSDAFVERKLVSPLKQRYEDLRKYRDMTVDIIAMVG